MTKKDGEKFRTIDHANKQADRERANPNRRLLAMMRRGECARDGLAGAVRGTRKVTKEPE